jgi:hypothetical protein
VPVRVPYILPVKEYAIRVHRTIALLASRAFKHCAVATWNNLHADIRNNNATESFHRRLKTALFRDMFDP